MTKKLEIGKIIVGAFLIPWQNRSDFIRALTIPLFFLLIFSSIWFLLKEQINRTSGWGLVFVFLIFFTFFAVACHRQVLLGKNLQSLWRFPVWTARETVFLFWLCLLCIAHFVISSAFIISMGAGVGAIVSDTKTLIAAFQGVILLSKLLATYIFARFCLVLPATATDSKVNLGWAWQLTQQNGWRLAVIVGALPWLISYLIKQIFRENATLLETVIIVLISFVLYTVEITAISLSYAELNKTKNPSP
jgi:hypothetical protein